MKTIPQVGERVRRLIGRAYSRTMLTYLLLSIGILICIVIGGKEIGHHLHSIEAWISGLSYWGVFAFIVLFALASSFLLPDTLLCITAGTLFGLGWGWVAVMAGSVLGAMLQYALARNLLHATIQHKLEAKPSLAAIQKAVLRNEFRLQVLLRLTPLNPATVSYLLGAAGVRFSGFLTACLALAPNLFVAVYLGHLGKHGVKLAGDPAHATHLHNLIIFGGLVVSGTVVFLVSRMARKAVLQAVAEVDSASAAPADSH